MPNISMIMLIFGMIFLALENNSRTLALENIDKDNESIFLNDHFDEIFWIKLYLI